MTPIQVLNPATGGLLAEVPAGTATDVDAAVLRAEGARRDWGRRPPGERAGVLLALADLLDAHRDELAALESANVGKPLGFAAGGRRVLRHPALLRRGRAHHDRHARCQYAPPHVVHRREPRHRRRHRAVELPAHDGCYKLGPALAAGNVVVLKPSELTPLSILRVAELARDILPPGVMEIVTGYGRDAGAAIAAHPAIRLVAVTGDVGTGQAVATAAAQSLKRTHLELGGKAPVVVLDDVDPAAVADAIKVAGYWNSGQDCLAACRVIATDRVYGDLVDALEPAVASLRVGDPAQGEVDMGPVVSARQQARVAGFLERATSAGAEVRGAGRFDSDGFSPRR